MQYCVAVYSLLLKIPYKDMNNMNILPIQILRGKEYPHGEKKTVYGDKDMLLMHKSYWGLAHTDVTPHTI